MREIKNDEGKINDDGKRNDEGKKNDKRIALAQTRDFDKISSHLVMRK